MAAGERSVPNCRFLPRLFRGYLLGQTVFCEMNNRRALGLIPVIVFIVACSDESGKDASVPDGGFDGDISVIDGASNQAPVINGLVDQEVDEASLLDFSFTVTDPDDPDENVRVFVSGLPPGALFDEGNRRLKFQPDFIQGGQTWTVTVIASDGRNDKQGSFKISVKDTIVPPEPTITETRDFGDHLRLTLNQSTDSFLDSPGYTGRSFTARISVPKSANDNNKLPVRMELHAFTGQPRDAGSGSEFQIHPADPMDSYWWGYSENLPAGSPTAGSVPNYTQRRALHLLGWVLNNYPGADPERVWVTGNSMGGAGALKLGLLKARHFCYVESVIGQTVAALHRPLRVEQLSTFWGTPTDNLDSGDDTNGVWHRLDLTRAIRDNVEVRRQFVFTKHSKDDPIIHFGSVVQKSPLTAVSFYEALQTYRLGHYVVWDEGGHGQDDPLLGPFWSDWDWNRITDSQSSLRRDLPFPAFHKSSADQDPGDGTGNGKIVWHENSGYAGDLSTPGDTGWAGDIAGARNRFLRWDSSKIIDARDRIEMPLRVFDGEGKDPPAVGYPSIGNKVDASLPIQVSVSIRRVQHFQCLPGESIAWTLGEQSGSVVADDAGLVTVEKLKLTTQWQTLVLQRAQ
jgi:hypothetical protein